MRVYRLRVKKDGQHIIIRNWYCDIWLRGKKHKLPLFKNLSESERFASKLDSLVGMVQSSQPLDAQTAAWLDGLPAKTVARLARIGLVAQSRVDASKDIAESIDAYRANLEHRGDTEEHVQRSVKRLNKVFDACGFNKLADVDAGRIQQYLLDQIKSGKLHPTTSNNYLETLRGFFNHLVQNDKLIKSPIRHLKPTKSTERKKERRPLLPAEISYLIQYTQAASDAYELSGHERAVLYRFAACTGLRVGEIRSLVVADFNADEQTITVKATNTKNRKEAILPLRQDVADALLELVKGKL